MSRAACCALVLALAVGISCWSVPDVDRRAVKPWLICSDCTRGELDRVVAMGPRVTRYLVAAIEDGPTAADDDHIAQNVREGVGRAGRNLQLRPGSTGQDSALFATVDTVQVARIVARQLADFRLRYRLRAAEALSRIDARADSAAVAALCANPPTELRDRPEYRRQLSQFGTCP